MRDFPSITGRAASGPIFPRPRTRLPSVIIAMLFHRFVYSKESATSRWISLDTAATPGVYQMEKASRERIGTFGVVATLPREDAEDLTAFLDASSPDFARGKASSPGRDAGVLQVEDSLSLC